MAVGNAKALRRTGTDPERLLWGGLRDRRLSGLKFRRQHPVAGGRFIVDFVCLERRLIVELDGSQHAPHVDGPRTAFLEAEGYRVLRFWNPDVLTNLNGVLETILATAQGKLPEE